MRVYWQAIADPETVIYDRYFDLKHSPLVKRYYPIENIHSNAEIYDHKNNWVNLMSVGRWTPDGQITWVDAQNDYSKLQIKLTSLFSR